MRSIVLKIVGVCLLAGVSSLSLLYSPKPVCAAAAFVPSYTAEGDMRPPTDYREWVFLTAGIDMSYNPKATVADHSMFDNVFVNPEAYRSFLATGTWPDKTVMVLESRGARNKGSINQRGHFQSTELSGLEVHVKDEARFPGKWAFFDFDSLAKNGKLFPSTAECYKCHADACRRGYYVCPVLSHAAAHCAGKEDAESGLSQGRIG